MNKMREEFEKWQIEEGHTDPMCFGHDWFKDGEYFLNDVQHDWEIWKASREQLIIKIPMTEEYFFSDYFEIVDIDTLKQSLESEGVKYE